MRGNREDSPPPFGASNASRARHGDPVARAARAAAEALDASTALGVLLHHVLEATGAERAFLARAQRIDGRLEPRVLARAASSGVRDPTPSRTVLQTALAGRRRVVCHDVALDARLWAGASVRGLDLRSVLSAPVPCRRASSTALVLDTRRPFESALSAPGELLDGFAALAALIVSDPRPLTAADERRERDTAIIGCDPAFVAVLQRLRRVASTDLPVLLVGESGSGKEALARLVHDESRRSDGPFVAVNCAAVPDGLLESEFFGAARGAYTGAERDRPGLFAAAHGGTLFLDEIGDMPLALQAKLLRVLQDGRVRAVGTAEEVAVDVRVVAATHRDLEASVARSRFRADLYWRVAVATCRVPPLRERRADLAPLAEHLIAKLSRRHGLEVARLDAGALERLEAYAWPGNVRELETVLARALLECRDGVLRARMLGVPSARPNGCARPDNLEAAMIRSALAQCDGNLSRAARRIGWTRQKLYRRIAALDLAGREEHAGPRPGPTGPGGEEPC